MPFKASMVLKIRSEDAVKEDEPSNLTPSSPASPTKLAKCLREPMHASSWTTAALSQLRQHITPVRQRFDLALATTHNIAVHKAFRPSAQPYRRLANDKDTLVKCANIPVNLFKSKTRLPVATRSVISNPIPLNRTHVYTSNQSKLACSLSAVPHQYFQQPVEVHTPHSSTKTAEGTTAQHHDPEDGAKSPQGRILKRPFMSFGRRNSGIPLRRAARTADKLMVIGRADNDGNRLEAREATTLDGRAEAAATGLSLTSPACQTLQTPAPGELIEMLIALAIGEEGLVERQAHLALAKAVSDATILAKEAEMAQLSARAAAVDAGTHAESVAEAAVALINIAKSLLESRMAPK